MMAFVGVNVERANEFEVNVGHCAYVGIIVLTICCCSCSSIDCGNNDGSLLANGKWVNIFNRAC
jgi:hypothetical protein